MKINTLFFLLFNCSLFLCCKKGDDRETIPVTIKGYTRDGSYSFTVTDQSGKQLASETNIAVNREFTLDDVKDGDVLTVKFSFHRMCSIYITTFGEPRSSYVYAINDDLSSEFTQVVKADQKYILY